MHLSSSAAHSSIAKTQGQSARSGSAPRAASRSSSNTPTTSGVAMMTASPSTTSPTITTPPGDRAMRRNSKQERERELVDNARLLRAWRNWHAEQLAEALTGLHRDVMGRLLAELKAPRSARELVAFIEAQDWSAVDANTRLIALHEINTAIMRLRERLGQEPIDDALPGEPLRAYQLIRNIMNQFPAPAGEPTSGNGLNRINRRQCYGCE